MDINLALLKRTISKRPDLKVVITSATMNADRLCNYFNAEKLKILGKTHSVERINWQSEESLEMDSEDDEEDYLTQAVTVCEYIHKVKPPGDILVFLTGQDEVIQACDMMAEKMEEKSPRGLALPLYGLLSQEEQSKAKKSREELNCSRKIIFATNVAETSITIAGVVYVVDSGRAKLKSFDLHFSSPILQIGFITRASAKQREGRAGRTQPGEYYPLYSKSDKHQMKEHDVPEIQRTDLTSLVLLLLRNRIHLRELELLDEAKPQAVAQAMETLFHLGALGEDKRTLTPKGKKMAMFPLAPQSVAMILRSEKEDLACSREVAIVAAMLESGTASFFTCQGTQEALKEQYNYKSWFNDESGDHITLMHLFLEFETQRTKSLKKRWCASNFISYRKMNEAQKLLLMIERAMKNANIRILSLSHRKILSSRELEERILKAVCAGYFENICVCNSHNSNDAGFTVIKTKNRLGKSSTTFDKTAFLHPSTTVSLLGQHLNADWLVFGQLFCTSRRFMHFVSRVRPEWIHEEAPPSWKEAVSFDKADLMSCG